MPGLSDSPAAPARLSVAPMMDWTDRHCRMFHRQFTRNTLLYSEMITALAVIHGDRDRLLGYDPREQPLALQLGGAIPGDLALAAGIGRDLGYSEINLNVGCPSDRVQSACFGAALMREPDLVAECAAAMIDAAGPVPVSIKCRIGIDEDDPQAVLPAFLQTVSNSGVRHFAIHARKAWLKGLSPKQNREVPPLDHALVLRMKAKFPHLSITINGGITGLDEARAFLDAGLDGVMIGRAAYHNPAMLGAADRVFFGGTTGDVSAETAVRAMLPYMEAQLRQGARLHQITRHMLGAFPGRPGAKSWRRMLSEGANRPSAGPDLVLQALDAVTGSQIAQIV